MQFVAPSLPGFPHLSLSPIVSIPVLLTILGLFFVIYLIISFTLFYHWIYYGMHSCAIVITEVLYSVVSIALVATAIISLSYL